MWSRVLFFFGLFAALCVTAVQQGAAQACCPDLRGNCLSYALNGDRDGDQAPPTPSCDKAAMQGCCRAAADVHRPDFAAPEIVLPSSGGYSLIDRPLAGGEIEPATPPPRKVRIELN
jgi:hypothetical protein